MPNPHRLANGLAASASALAALARCLPRLPRAVAPAPLVSLQTVCFMSPSVAVRITRSHRDTTTRSPPAAKRSLATRTPLRTSTVPCPRHPRRHRRMLGHAEDLWKWSFPEVRRPC